MEMKLPRDRFVLCLGDNRLPILDYTIAKIFNAAGSATQRRVAEDNAAWR